MTPDKWFRVNEIVRNNDALKTALNENTSIQTQFEAMLTIVNEITTTLGLGSGNQGSPATAKLTAFPIPKMFWMGQLALDTYIDGPEDRQVPEHRLAFATAASALRKKANVIIASWRLDQDAYNKDSEGNPGGEVEE